VLGQKRRSAGLEGLEGLVGLVGFGGWDRDCVGHPASASFANDERQARRTNAFSLQLVSTDGTVTESTRRSAKSDQPGKSASSVTLLDC
jgi:hypothetical protein